MTRSSARRRRVGVPLVMVAVAAAMVAGAAAAGTDFVAGSGRARASLLEVAPRTGGLTIPISFGRSVASYQGTRAEASSLAVKPPSETPSRTAGGDCGGTPAPPGGGPGAGGGGGGFSFPFRSTISVDSESEEGPAGRQATFASTPSGQPVQAALQEQDVSARRDPFGEAVTTSGRVALADVVALTAGRAVAGTGIVDGATRLARSTVTIGRLSVLRDAVVVEDLRWEATHRTGQAEAADGTFTVGKVTVAGVPVPAPPDEGRTPLDAINTALAPTGLAFDPPRVDHTDGVVRVSPLTVRIADSPLGRDAIGPVLGALQPARDPLVDVLLGVSCDFGGAITLADVLAGVASGSGGVSFDVGGVSATTEGTRFENPFAGGPGGVFPGTEEGTFDAVSAPPPAAAGDIASVAPDPAADRPPPLPAHQSAPTHVGLGSGPGPGAELAGPAAGPDPGATVQPALGPSSRRLPGTRGGTAFAIGVLGLAAVLGVAGADGLRMRRAARTIP